VNKNYEKRRKILESEVTEKAVKGIQIDKVLEKVN